MQRLLGITLAAVLLLSSASMVAAAKGQFNVKFTFSGVTLTDGSVTYDNAVIEAASKQTGGSTFTSCNYYTAGYATFLGYYQDAAFASSDAATVQTFCAEHFAERTR